MNNIKTNVLFFLLGVLIFTAFAAISFFQPGDLIDWLVRHDGWGIEMKPVLQIYIQELTWFKFKCILVFAFFVLLYLWIFDRYFFRSYIQAFGYFFHSIKNDFLNYSTHERTMLCTTLLCFASGILLYSTITPLQLDELHSWLFFIDKGAWVTASYYPSANNHIAYNLLSTVWNIFLSPVWAVRIVSMIASWCAVGLFYMILRRRYNLLFSFTGILLLMTSAPFLWYSVQGRGYVLELLLLVILLYVLSGTFYNTNTDRLIIVCNVWALYTVPIAVIPVALLNAYYAYHLNQEGKEGRVRLITITAHSAMFIILCYSPVLVFSGASSLFTNSFVTHVLYNETLAIGILRYMPELWEFISGCDGWWSLCLMLTLASAAWYLLWKGNRLIIAPVTMFFVPFLLLQFYPVLLFERTWLWLIIPFVFLNIEIAVFFTEHAGKWIISIVFILFAVTICFNLIRSYETNRLLVKHADQFLQLEYNIEARLKGKVLRVYDDAVYDYLLYRQKESASYTLLYGDQQPGLKADVLLMDGAILQPSKGTVVWSDGEKVLFIPK